MLRSYCAVFESPLTVTEKTKAGVRIDKRAGEPIERMVARNEVHDLIQPQPHHRNRRHDVQFYFSYLKHRQFMQRVSIMSFAVIVLVELRSAWM